MIVAPTLKVCYKFSQYSTLRTNLNMIIRHVNLSKKSLQHNKQKWNLTVGMCQISWKLSFRTTRLGLASPEPLLSIMKLVKPLKFIKLLKNKQHLFFFFYQTQLQFGVVFRTICCCEIGSNVFQIEGKNDLSLPNVTTDGVKTLEIVNSASLLGLEIDNMLSFNLHVEMICKKRSSRIAVLRKIRVFLPLSQRLLYYNAIIRPVLSYLSVIWSSWDKESLNRVLKLQKHAARVILYADRQASSVALFNKLHWIPFYEQCNIDKCSI